jgi:NAD(P)-dependent dehydrogenase (short-subunit alcohol dehydrogenase family)
MAEIEGKVAIVTGANTGIGRVTALEQARRGARVVMACRSRDKSEPVVDAIRRASGNDDVTLVLVDLGDLDSVRRAAASMTSDPVHLLINNAGLAGARGLTPSGFELAFGTNHVGHFLWTQLLLDRVKAAATADAPARIVNVSSTGHYRATGIDWQAVRQPTKSVTGLLEYEVSKLANVLFTVELARRLDGEHVHSYALHPGRVASDVWRRVPWPFRGLLKLFMISNEQGAATTLHCALSEQAASETGRYYDDCRLKEPSAVSQDPALAKELWSRSEEWVA